jgi:DNA-binding NarL/FixJ family response regulator
MAILTGPVNKGRNMTPVRIILVDDHEFLRAGLRVRLSQEAGLEVVGEAGSASEAQAVCARTRADLVVLDLGLPDKSGLEMTAEIRATWPKMKIVVLTGDSHESATREAIRAGADGFVRKEEAAAELLRAIRVVMAGESYLSPVAATAVTRGLRQKPPAEVAPAGPALTERETEVLRGLAEGQAYKEIASDMNVSVRTVETYRARVVRKLGCSTRAELVRYAVRQGLVKP